MKNNRFIAIACIAGIGLTSMYGVSIYKQSGKGLDPTNFDTSIKPGDDFYQYANGNWLRQNQIPSTESAWGSFNELHEKNNQILRGIMEEAAKGTAKESYKKKIGDFYFTAMDSVTLNKNGAKPLAEEFALIDNIKDTKQMLSVISHENVYGIRPLFSFFVYQDMKISTQMAAYIGQGGLGMPDRDYYTNEDEESKQLQQEYLKHISKMFVLLGDAPAKADKNAQSIMRIETALAKASMTRVEQRDMEAQYNKKTIAEVQAITPSIDWNKFLAEVSVKGMNEIIVAQPKFFAEVENQLKTTSIEDWKTYLKWNVVNSMADVLSDNFVKQNFEFYGKTLSGTPEMKPRWKRALGATDAALGDAVGQAFVEKTFSPESKKKINDMVDNLTYAFQERIKSLDWMTPATKEQAQKKLSTIIRKLGYPDKWKDYSTLEITRESYAKNYMRANEYEWKRMVNKIGKPVDKTEWGMSAPTINAYYNPSINEIVFPAGIMQPPFFTPDADDAINYASIGAVIGHELTHGFDDQGAMFDAEGNMKNWWSAEDMQKFQTKTKMVEEQFSSYEPLTGVKVNGKLTLGENIADLGGLNMAYQAYKHSLKGKPEPPKIDGFTGEQRFFLGWATIWRWNARDEYMKQMVMTNPHSPGKFRVNGPLSNMPEFYAAFDIKEGDKMYKPAEQRAKIW
jgi:putative endopeptidase